MNDNADSGSNPEQRDEGSSEVSIMNDNTHAHADQVRRQTLHDSIRTSLSLARNPMNETDDILLLLVKEWLQEQLKIYEFWSWDVGVGSLQMRMAAYAGILIGSIRGIVGDELVDRACEEAETEFRASRDSNSAANALSEDSPSPQYEEAEPDTDDL